MAEGGKKDGVFIATVMLTAMSIVGAESFFLAILDGASNMQSAGRIITAKQPHMAAVHCALHIVHLIFGMIALIAEVAALIERYRAIRTWLYAHHFNMDLFKSSARRPTATSLWGSPRPRTRASAVTS